MSEYYIYAWCPWRPEECTWPLGLELQMVLIYVWVLGIELVSSGRETNVLNYSSISAASQSFHTWPKIKKNIK